MLTVRTTSGSFGYSRGRGVIGSPYFQELNWFAWSGLSMSGFAFRFKVEYASPSLSLIVHSASSRKLPLTNPGASGLWVLMST